MKAKLFLLVIFSAAALFISTGGLQGAGDPLVKKALRWHSQVFTVDTHCDTPFMLLEKGWDIGKYHAPGQPRQRLPGLPAHEGRRPRCLLFRRVRLPRAQDGCRERPSQGQGHRRPGRLGRDVCKIPGPVRPGPDAAGREGPEKAGQARHFHRHGKRLPPGPRPGPDRLFLRPRRALRHPGPYRRQRHLRLLDRPQGPRRPRFERFRAGRWCGGSTSSGSWSTSPISPTVLFRRAGTDQGHRSSHRIPAPGPCRPARAT